LHLHLTISARQRKTNTKHITIHKAFRSFAVSSKRPTKDCLAGPSKLFFVSVASSYCDVSLMFTKRVNSELQQQPVVLSPSFINSEVQIRYHKLFISCPLLVICFFITFTLVSRPSLFLLSSSLPCVYSPQAVKPSTRNAQLDWPNSSMFGGRSFSF